MILIKGLLYVMLGLIVVLALAELYFVLLQLYYAIEERSK